MLQFLVRVVVEEVVLGLLRRWRLGLIVIAAIFVILAVTWIVS